MSCGLLQEVMPEELPSVVDIMEEVKDRDVEDGEDTELQEHEEEDPSSDDVTLSDEEQSGVSEGWINLYNNQLKKMVIISGDESVKPEPRSICCVNLVGCLKEGTEFESQEPLSLQLGDAEAVLGIDLVLLSMSVGEKSLVEVSPALGYGSLGRIPDVPPNQVLIYLIELVSCQAEPELKTYSGDELMQIGVRKRERGNWWHNRQEYQLALTCYQRALEYLEPSCTTADLDQLLLEDRLKVFNNIGSVYLKLHEYNMALNYIDQVLRCQPENVKALFRKGKILSALGRPKDALQVFSKAVELEPTNNAAIREMKASQDVLKSQEKLSNKVDGAESDVTFDGANVADPSKVSLTPTKSTSLDPKFKLHKPKRSSKNINKHRKGAQSRARWDLIFIGTAALLSVGVIAYRYRNQL